MLKLLYISQLAEPQMHDLSIYAGQADGEDDVGWFRARVQELGLGEAVDITAVRVCLGDAIPDANGFDAAIVGGSYHMVGERREWQRRVLAWLQGARAAQRPVLGICGGHQLMAAFHGARVSPLAEGPWGATLGVQRTPDGHRHWLFKDVDEAVGFHFGNAEHVSPAPAGAQVLARTDTSPALALDYDDGWVSVQFHPEMTVEGFARYWRSVEPARVAAYRSSPGAPLLLRNFIERAASTSAQARHTHARV